ncbi:MAG TPA: TrmJ/YjtD family RNA methyltransferase [Bryobacteraceae bacterium]|nr:TrmJ/YjtD family RNA methyltransferase [Bryobacteraceae bacterium]
MQSDSLRVVLVAPRNPLNIGAAARAMSNFGFLRLRVVNPYEIAYAEAKSAVNAAALLENSEQYSTVADAIADCTLVVGTTAVGHRQLQHSLRRLEYGARLIRQELDVGRVALLFGTEKFGLSNEDMARCHWLMRIPTRNEHESMNLGQAVAVCLYELIRSSQVETDAPKAQRSATAENVDRIADLLVDSLQRSGYIKDLTSESGEQKTRRMVRRLQLTRSDALALLGMLRQILWKLKNP